VFHDEGVLVREGDADVLFYQRTTKSQEGKYPRAHYLHPVYNLDGNVLTEDFPRDHLHHRGVFWAWHQLWLGERKLGDGWACQDFAWDVQDVTTHDEGPDRLTLKTRVIWKSPQAKDDAGNLVPLVDERTAIHIHRAADDARKIDFEIRLLALQENMRLGGSEDEKGYGGFSVRVRLPEGVRFLGEKGEAEPQVTAVEAGRWLDISGPYGKDEAADGVTILEHPSLPGFPQPWILRGERSMQNPAFPGREPVTLSTETPLVLRYRLVIHRGAADPERIQNWFAEYAKD
jgi:hypothetical protein